MLETGTEELDKLADHADFSQPLGDREHQIGGGRAFLQIAGEPKAEHRRDQHRDRLP